MSDLKKCPFCGSSATLILIGTANTFSRGAKIRCGFCPCYLDISTTKYGLDWCEFTVKEMWNRRFPNQKEDLVMSEKFLSFDPQKHTSDEIEFRVKCPNCNISAMEIDSMHNFNCGCKWFRDKYEILNDEDESIED